MQIVIDIPEDVYIARKYGEISPWVTGTILDAVEQGTPLDDIKADIERLHYHPKLDFIKNDEVVEMALEIIDKHISGDMRGDAK